MNLYLHEKGYTFHTIPKLTYAEINSLCRAENRKQKEQEKINKKAERKSKRKRR